MLPNGWSLSCAVVRPQSRKILSTRSGRPVATASCADYMEATGLTMNDRVASSCHTMHARSSQEASHVLRRTGCASEVCVHRRAGPDGEGSAGGYGVHEGPRAAAGGARALPSARGGGRDVPLLAVA